MVDRVHVYPLAISAVNGEIEFFQSAGVPPGYDENAYPDGWHLSGSVRPPKKHLETHPWCTFESTLIVEGSTLDTWTEREGIDAIDLVWADVQGAEIDLISGGRRALDSARFFYTEYNEQELYDGQVGLSEILEALPGWEIETQYRNDVLLRNTGFS